MVRKGRDISVVLILYVNTCLL